MTKVRLTTGRVAKSLIIVFYLIAGISSFPIITIGVAESRTFSVPDDYLTIQEAINAATPGDTIKVAPGIYHENIIINKTLSLIAQNQNTIINSTKGNIGSVVIITAINASIMNFTIQGGDTGIFLHGRKDLEVFTVVKGNIIMNAKNGVYVYWSNGSLITENIIVNNTNGIFVYWSRAHLTKNIIGNNSYGTIVTGSRSSTYDKNIFKNNSCGMHIQWTQQPHIVYHNDFINNIENVQVLEGIENIWDDGYPSGGNFWSDYEGFDNYSGLNQDEPGTDGIGDAPYIIDAYNLDRYPLMKPQTHQNAATWTVDNNGSADFRKIQEAINAANPLDIIYVRKGTYYENIVVNKTVSLLGENRDSTIIDGSSSGTVVHVTADNVTIEGFTIKNGEIGLHIHNSAKSIVKNNRITHNRFDGIKTKDATNITIAHNILSRNSQHGVFLFRSSNNTINNSTITNDSRWSVGIFIYFSNNNEIRWNNVTGTGDNEGGIELAYSSNNILQNNRISRNTWSGISLRYSDDNTITGNTITDHQWFGMRITYSNGNYIYHNNLINNVNQVSLVSSNATWNLHGLGNYWNSHTLPDNDPDGVCDSPYQIDENNVDHFPLMGKVYTFVVHKDYESKVLMVSNSTITNFTYLMYIDSQSSKPISLIKFNITGQNESPGFCRVTIPHTLLEGPYQITVNDSSPLMETQIHHASNTTHTTLYFQYHHSTKQIVIIGEFPTLLYPTLVLLISLIIALARKRRLAEVKM